MTQLSHLSKLGEEQPGGPEADKPADHQEAKYFQRRLGPAVSGRVALDQKDVENQGESEAGEWGP